MSMLKSFIRLRPLRRAHQPVIPTRFFASTSISSGYSLHSAQSKTAPSIRHIPSLTHFPNNSLSRSFHSTNRRQDVLFVAMPALKSGLLNITRFTLLFLPFAIRYKLWKRYRRISLLLLQIPVFAVCIILALGLDQSPRTKRWRLLLMSEHEELAWSRRKQKEILRNDGHKLLPPNDPRSRQVARVTTRLITALEEEDRHIVYGANWPPKSQELSRLISERESLIGEEGRYYPPSGTAKSTYVPYRPPTRNPLKQFESPDWRVYVINSPEVNAFALPSRDVFVYTGLLDTLPGDDVMLSAILAHEIAHVVERHTVENLGFLNLATVGFDVLRGLAFAFTISFPFIADSAGVCINWINNVLADRAYSRRLEMEADAVGLQIMATAGYDPRAASDLWELMACVEDDAAAMGQGISVENRFSLLRTHPTSDVRQKALSKDMEGALKIWRDHRRKRQPKRVEKKQEKKDTVPESDKVVSE
ncbi:metalloendopeptidase [Cryptococcus neoformans A2-102-5]|nr:metalloendopeptidase [Cryptococcus neoformans var. grubii Bt15]OXG37412.1 metalloendopeptidase [Cryptococcus neoformans var. grubii Bt120]OXG81523.1 metalloendopeptidase [Cryptococcus neoformans var. grubii D17-1]OXG93680.1 metalloendopeptidase [Cryptococcus neoformans var. grubii A2-102-5]